MNRNGRNISSAGAMAGAGFATVVPDVENLPTENFTFTGPLTRQIFQRQAGSTVIPITGATSGNNAKARLLPIAGELGSASDWQPVTITNGQVTGSIAAQPGWYDLQLKCYSGTRLVSDSTLNKIGVGDLFLTCGQSNFGNFYQPLVTTNPNDKINSRGLGANVWRRAADPQATCDGTFSSVFPKLGDLITARTGYPVGFLNVAVSNSIMSSWAQAGANYSRLTQAVAIIGATKSVLLHIGETDASASRDQTSFTTSLKSMIDGIRVATGVQTPIGIARTTHPNEAIGTGVLAACLDVGTNYAGCFLGAYTDTLGNSYRTDTVHFNSSTGRDAHAALWFDALIAAGLI
jgi:hypothetical protein